MREQKIKKGYIKKHVAMLAGNIGERNTQHPQALLRAADYIVDQWQAMGFEVRPQYFQAQGVECRNLEVTHIGTSQPGKIILIGAHYDSAKNCPGANDNASGVATLLEISRAIIQSRTKCSIRFVAFSNQAPPFFGTEEMGSWVYAHHARQRGDNIRAAIILDSLGYYSDKPASQLAPMPFSLFCPHRGDFVATLSNLRSRGVARHFSKLFCQHTVFPCKQVSAPQLFSCIASSDQTPFWLNGYKAFMVTDTSRYRYPFYRSAKDTPDRIDYDSIDTISDGIAKTLIDMEL